MQAHACQMTCSTGGEAGLVIYQYMQPACLPQYAQHFQAVGKGTMRPAEQGRMQPHAWHSISINSRPAKHCAWRANCPTVHQEVDSATPAGSTWSASVTAAVQLHCRLRKNPCKDRRMPSPSTLRSTPHMLPSMAGRQADASRQHTKGQAAATWCCMPRQALHAIRPWCGTG